MLARLVWAAHLGESPAVLTSAIAYRIGASSPQSFNRTVRNMMGMTARRRPLWLALDVGHDGPDLLPRRGNFDDPLDIHAASPASQVIDILGPPAARRGSA